MTYLQDELTKLENKNNETLDEFRKYIKSLKDYGLSDMDIERLDDYAIELMDIARSLGHTQAVFDWK